MKISSLPIWITILTAIFLFSGCAAQSKTQEGPAKTAAAMPSDPSSSSAAGADKTASDQKPAAKLSKEDEALLEDDWDRSEDQEPQKQYMVADPIEPVNRAIFTFNDKLYVWLLRPLALGYRKVTPRIMRTGIQNFFTNLAAPIRIVNSALQGKGKAASVEFGKFLVNSTVGGLGFGDLFTHYPELYPDPEDLGQSLATYGIHDGFYIVLPFLGPSTLRDTVGQVGDAFLDPVNYIDPTSDALAVKGFNSVNRLSFRIEDIDDAKRAALDPYEAARNFYIQSRQNRIKK
jgi:phospholipid-binding lipoprotein MlaA